jgi:hypothetical protein
MGRGGGRSGRRRSSRNRRRADALAALIFSGALFAAPTPTVSLDSVLADPPTAGYAPDAEGSGTPVGHFDAGEYASYEGGGADAMAALGQDGFADGFGASWTEQSDGRALVELVVAFTGGHGARSWLATAQAAAKGSDYYKGSIVVFGIGPYFGAHFADPTHPSYADAISFVKGNDFFTVGFYSKADDLGDAAAMQAKKQFDSAPNDSIPPAQWPENLSLLAGGLGVLKLAAIAALVIVILGFVISCALFFYVRRKESAQAGAKLSLDAKSHPPDG